MVFPQHLQASEERQIASPSRAAGGFAAHRGLILAAAGGAMAEAGVLLAVAPGARALAPQVTALAPLAVFHDLRWLYAGGTSWPVFCAALLAVLTARTVLDAALVRLAWPAELPRPGWPALLWPGAAAVALTAALLSPLVTLDFGVALLPFSWPLLAVLPVLLLIACLLGHAGVVPWWWRVLPPARVVAWLAADFVVLSAAAALIGWLPGGWAVPAAGLAGLGNACAWYGVTHALVSPSARLRRPARRLPAAPLAALTAVAVVIALTRLIFAVLAAGAPTGQTVADVAPGPAGAARAAAPGRPAVLDVEGFGSSCCASPRALRRLSPGGIVQQFSYRGLDRAGRPLPNGRAASDLPLAALGDRIAAQVWRLHRRAGQPVDVIAESEGTLGVYAMLARHPRVPIGSVVLLSPILDPGQLSYSDRGGGRGLVPGYELRAVVSFIGSLSPYGASGATRLISSVNRSGARFASAAVAAARHRRFRWLLVIPLADAVTMPSCALPAQAVVVPALHGSLAGDPEVQSIVRAFLADRRVRARPGLAELAETVAAAAVAWRMPTPAASPAACRRP